MNIDIIVAKLVKKGMTQAKAETFANNIIAISKEYGISVSKIIDESSSNIKFNELGNFLTNTVRSKGYRTGKRVQDKSSDIVSRTIIK